MSGRVYHNHPPSEINGKYLCTRCGGQFSKEELKRCPVCGFYFCPSCITHHHCISLKDGTVILNDDYSIEKVDKTQPIDLLKTRAMCSVCGEPQLLKDLMQCQSCKLYFCKNHYDHLIKCPVWGKYFCSVCYPKHRDEETEAANWVKCEGCGEVFHKSDMRRCKKCGRVYCRKCQRKHVCWVAEYSLAVENFRVLPTICFFWIGVFYFVLVTIHHHFSESGFFFSIEIDY